MTKPEIIANMYEFENSYYTKYLEKKAKFGAESKEAKRMLAKWAEIDELIGDCGLKTVARGMICIG